MMVRMAGFISLQNSSLLNRVIGFLVFIGFKELYSN